MSTVNYSATEYYDKGLVSFSKAVLPLDGYSTKFEQNEVSASTISVPLFDSTAQIFSSSVGYMSSGSISEVSVPVSHVFVSNSIDVSQASSNPAAYLPSFYEKQMKELAGAITERALGDVASYTNKVHVPSASFGFNVVKSGQGVLDAANAGNDRVILTRGLWNSALSPNSVDGTRVTVEDYGFGGKYRAPLTGVVGAAMFAPASYAVAVGLPTDPLKGTNALVSEQNLVDPETNIPMRHKVFADATKGKLFSVFETIVGGKVAIAGGGYLVTGAA